MAGALLIDLENLAGGHHGRHADLEFAQVYQAIVEQLGGQRLQVRRAYADWGSPRMQRFRGDLLEFGIEPVHVFNSSFADGKNFADMHMAVDAMELCLTRPFLQHFVLVSGDGGFTAVARRLRDHGRQVLGVGVKGTVASSLIGVCDDYVILALAETGGASGTSSAASTAALADPRIAALLPRIVMPDDPQGQNPLALGRSILMAIGSAPSLVSELQAEGLNINLFTQIAEVLAPGFDHVAAGYAKRTDYISAASHGLDVALYFRPPSEYRLARAGRHLPGFRPVAIPCGPTLQSSDGYQYVLKRHPAPVIFTIKQDLYRQIGQVLAQDGHGAAKTIEDWLATMIMHSPMLTEREVKGALYTLVNLGVLEPSANGAATAPRYAMAPVDAADLETRVMGAAAAKLAAVIGSVDQTILAALAGG